MKTLILAHYYTTHEVQQMANYVGDSLDLSIKAKESKAERIVFAGVKFMAETAKILNPSAEVILPDAKSTCSLVTQVDNELEVGITALYKFITDLRYMMDRPFKVVTYINSSAKLKTLSDIIVTSVNVENIIDSELKKGNRVLFTPDRNMGAYLESQHPEWGIDFDYWKGAVCEVHDKFKADELNKALGVWTDGAKYVLAHPESPLPVLSMANMVGSTSKMLQWVKDFPNKVGTIFVATEEGLLYNMCKLRPELDIRQAPVYSGCQCTSCPYMKLNTAKAVKDAIEGNGGLIIDYLSEETINAAKLPIERMLNYANT